MTKAELRRTALAERDALPAKDAQAASEAIWQRLRALPEFGRARSIMFFANFSSEVRTLPMIDEALGLGKWVVLPIADVQTNELDLREVRDLQQDTAPGVWGIPEPRRERCRLVRAAEIDLVVAPGVAFDETGGRLGYGGGFYDAFLQLFKQERPDALVVALAFELQIVEKVPTKPSDVPIPLILTERRAIDNRGGLSMSF